MPSSHNCHSQMSSLIREIAADIGDDDNYGSKFYPPSAHPQLQQSIVEVFGIIGPTYFRCAIHMTYDSSSCLHMKIKSGIWAAARRLQNISTGVCTGGITCCLPFLMDWSIGLFVWHAHCITLLGGLHMTDNAYLNSLDMVTPFPNVSSGIKDDLNFFHSQQQNVLSVHLECWVFHGRF